MGGLGITNLCHIAASESKASTAMTEPLVKQIVVQTHKLQDNHAIILEHCTNETVEIRMHTLEKT